jgi:hypothetical protein
MTRVRVNQGKSVLHKGEWHDQRAEFDCMDPKEYGDAVTIIEPKKTKPETSEISSGKEK